MYHGGADSAPGGRDRCASHLSSSEARQTGGVSKARSAHDVDETVVSPGTPPWYYAAVIDSDEAKEG
jgi:hypothetical protein